MFPGFEFVRELRGGLTKANFCVRFCQTEEDDDEGLLCLKVMHPSAMSKERFQREVEILSKLESHPNLAQLVMENEMTYQGSKIQFFCETFIEGTDLEDKLESKPWSLQRSCLFMAQVCDGLDALERMMVIHRDLKPTNIRVTLEDRPVLIDLGIAKALDLPGLTKATDEQPGTPAYLSPEQAKNEPSQICSATDLHAVGIILYRLLTGLHPFYIEGMSSEEVVFRIIGSEEYKDQREFQRLTPKVRDLIGRLLEKEPSNRPQSASSVACELRSIVSDSRESSSRNLLDLGLALSSLATAATVVISNVNEEALVELLTDEQAKLKLGVLMELLKKMPDFPDGEDPFLAATRNGSLFIAALKEACPVQCPLEIAGMLIIGSCWQQLDDKTLNSLEWPRSELCRLAVDLGKLHLPPQSFTRPPFKQILRNAVDALPEHHNDWDSKAIINAICLGLGLEPESLFRPEVLSALETFAKNLKVSIDKREDNSRNRLVISANSATSLEIENTALLNALPEVEPVD